MSLMSSSHFLQCCSVLAQNTIKLERLRKRLQRKPFEWQESCVLCGTQYNVDNREGRLQRKPHFVNSHADYLGSTWDGTGTFNGEPVNATRMITEPDVLNHLLVTITKNLHYKIMPACNVITRR